MAGQGMQFAALLMQPHPAAAALDGLDPTVVSPAAISENTPKPDVLGFENPLLSQYFRHFAC
jgi:hypothetical protein